MEINDIHDPVSKMRTPGNDAPDLRMSVYIYMYVYIYIYIYVSLSLSLECTHKLEPGHECH